MLIYQCGVHKTTDLFLVGWSVEYCVVFVVVVVGVSRVVGRILCGLCCCCCRS